VNTSKRLVNDISGGHPCGAHSVVTKVENYFKDQLSQPFVLTPNLCGWIFCEFRNQVELALIAFAKAPVYDSVRGQLVHLQAELLNILERMVVAQRRTNFWAP
jgi:hypothetical protein